MWLLDTLIDMAVDGVAEIAEAVITKKIKRKTAEKRKLQAKNPDLAAQKSTLHVHAMQKNL